MKLPSTSNTPESPHTASNNFPLGSVGAGSKENLSNEAQGISNAGLGGSSGKTNRLVPAVPLASPAIKPTSTSNGVTKGELANGTVSRTTKADATGTASNKAQTIDEANRDARAAVAAAMAKLPTAPKARETGAVDHLANKINQLNTGEGPRAPHQPGHGPHFTAQRGGRGGPRRGNRDNTRKTELPKSDYDFESANAKFNKQDLVKEAIATGSALGSPDPRDGEANGDGAEPPSSTTSRASRRTGHSATTMDRNWADASFATRSARRTLRPSARAPSTTATGVVGIAVAVVLDIEEAEGVGEVAGEACLERDALLEPKGGATPQSIGFGICGYRS